MHLVPVGWVRAGWVSAGWREHKHGYMKTDLQAIGHLKPSEE